MSNDSIVSAIGTSLRRRVRNALAGAFPEIREYTETAARNAAEIRKLTDLVLSWQTRQLQADNPNPLNRFGRKCFSQTDEDGITMEILNRIGLVKGGSFAEYGVGDGMENNTLILASLGWKGFWIGAQDLAFGYFPNERFLYQKEWITADNILELTARGLAHLQVDNPDVVSIDVDGNDIHFTAKLLSAPIRPKLFIVEYNAKFPPPVEFQITYDPAHRWQLDDYFGASLCSFVRLFSAHDYRLVCCNTHTGANAFFIDSIYEKHFPDVPTDINQLYVEPRYFLYNNYGHKRSVKVIEKVLGQRPPVNGCRKSVY